jgi:DNA-binding NtrC family response regulator
MPKAHTPPAVLLIDDEPRILFSSKTLLRGGGIAEVETLEDSRQVLPLLAQRRFGAIVLDLFMPHTSGQDLLPVICREYPETPVIIMTASDELELAVECMKKGAYDYLVKPVEKACFLSTVRRALEMSLLRDEVTRLKEQIFSQRLEHAEAFAPIVTNSPKMATIFRYIEAIASLRQPVLITGETGVGKELVARSVHRLSGLSGRFVPINVAGLDDTLFTDTLFGHKKGAFTGAERQRAGLITQAAGGTLFLDEIGDLRESSQVKLLRLLQEGEYYPVGSDLPKKSDARIIVATNRNLQEEVTQKRFRKDLYYRLCAHQVHIPPLRERLEDIPLLLDHFLEKAAAELQRAKPSIPPELVQLLSAHHFPGNIRELEGLAFDAAARHRSGVLSLESFRKAIAGRRLEAPSETLPEQTETDLLYRFYGRFPTLKEMDALLIVKAMQVARDNQGVAASLLGISRQALNQRLKRKKDA